MEGAGGVEENGWKVKGLGEGVRFSGVGESRGGKPTCATKRRPGDHARAVSEFSQLGTINENQSPAYGEQVRPELLSKAAFSQMVPANNWALQLGQPWKTQIHRRVGPQSKRGGGFAIALPAVSVQTAATVVAMTANANPLRRIR